MPRLLAYGGTDGALAQHVAACKALVIKDYRLHDGRHTWAVRHIAAGVPAEPVAEQLGHADTKEVNELYGRFRPTKYDRERYAQMAEKRDREAGAEE